MIRPKVWLGPVEVKIIRPKVWLGPDPTNVLYVMYESGPSQTKCINKRYLMKIFTSIINFLFNETYCKQCFLLIFNAYNVWRLLMRESQIWRCPNNKGLIGNGNHQTWPSLLCRFISLQINKSYKSDIKINKNGVLWSQTRMRIEMRLRCFLVI